MTAYLCPVFQEPQLSDNDEFLAGGLLWFYEAGTNTPTMPYTTPAGDVPYSNPIVLDSRGSPGITIWLAGGQSYRIVLEDKPYYGQTHGTVITEHDNITGINDPSVNTVDSNWILFDGNPTYVSGTSFSVTGDQRSIFSDRRRLYSNNTGGVIYSSIVSASYASGVTTVTVTNDSGSLDTGLSSVYYSFSLPVALPTDLYVVSQFISGRGYTKLSNGLIIQWDNTTVSVPGPDTILFPLAFTTVYSVVAQPVGSQSAYAVLSSITNSEFTVTQHGSSENANLMWIAIGV